MLLQNIASPARRRRRVERGRRHCGLCQTGGGPQPQPPMPLMNSSHSQKETEQAG